jgi:hypothetical protein
MPFTAPLILAAASVCFFLAGHSDSALRSLNGCDDICGMAEEPLSGKDVLSTSIPGAIAEKDGEGEGDFESDKDYYGDDYPEAKRVTMDKKKKKDKKDNKAKKEIKEKMNKSKTGTVVSVLVAKHYTVYLLI